MPAPKQPKYEHSLRGFGQFMAAPVKALGEAVAPMGSINFAGKTPRQAQQQAALSHYAQGGAAPAPQTGGGTLSPFTSPQPQTYSGLSYDMRRTPGAMAPPMPPAPNSPYSPGGGPQPMQSYQGQPQSITPPGGQLMGRQIAPPQLPQPTVPLPPMQGRLPQGPQPQLPVPQVDDPYQGLGLAERSFVNDQGQLPTPNRSAMPAINQFRQDYRQQQLGGMHDAATEIWNANRYNAGRPVSPFNPLAAPISGPGIYGQAVNAGGLMNNAEAQQFQQNVGYMPSRTVGGAFGGPGGQPLPFEKAPATGAQIDAYLGQNPNGRFFQGATPGMVQTARGLRPGFTDGQPLPDLSQKPKFNAGDYETTPSGALKPSSATQLAKGKEAEAVFDSRRGGLEARRKAYEERVASSAKERKAGVKENAQQRFEARRARRGLFTNEEQIARANPAAYQARQAEGERSKAFAANAEADRASREKLGLAAVEQRDRAAEAELKAKRIDNNLPEGGATPPKVPPVVISESGGKKTELTQEESADIHATAIEDPALAEQKIRAKGGSKEQAVKEVRRITGEEDYGKGFWDRGVTVPTPFGNRRITRGDAARNVAKKAKDAAAGIAGAAGSVYRTARGLFSGLPR